MLMSLVMILWVSRLYKRRGMTKGELKRLVYQIEDKGELVRVLWDRLKEAQ